MHKDVSSVTGYTFGTQLEIPVTHDFSVVSGIRYARVSGRVNFDPTWANGHFTINRDVMAVPLLISYDLTQQLIRLDLGGEVLYLLSARAKVDTVSVSSTRYRETIDIGDQMDSFSASAVIGFRISGARMGLPLELMVRYHHGLSGVAKAKEWVSDWTTRELSFAMLYDLQR